MTTLNSSTLSIKKSEPIGEIDIDFLISDIIIIKAESVKDRKIFKYAEYLEKQLLKIKNREAVLDLGVPLK